MALDGGLGLEGTLGLGSSKHGGSGHAARKADSFC